MHREEDALWAAGGAGYGFHRLVPSTFSPWGRGALESWDV